jgi:hypothetical protein
VPSGAFSLIHLLARVRARRHVGKCTSPRSSEHYIGVAPAARLPQSPTIIDEQYLCGLVTEGGLNYELNLMMG